jgi:transcriptional regulator with XRE-family HTH domain
LINERRAFGDRLRRQRERQHVGLAQIAETTKVAASLFAGLERGDCSRWPGGVYNRAFIRGYALAVGLDPEETTAEFVEYYETPSDGSAKQASAPADSTARPPLRLGLEDDPAENWSRALRTLALTLADVAVIGALAAVVVLTTAVPFWNALAFAAIGYHAAARILGSLPRIDRRWLKSAGAPGDPVQADEEVAVSGTASTVA